MSNKNTVFHRQNKEFKINFSSDNISSDTSLILLEKIERKHKIIKKISSLIPDYRSPFFTIHSYEKMLKQRVFLLMQGYEDANDAAYLKNDPVLQTILDGNIVVKSGEKYTDNFKV